MKAETKYRHNWSRRGAGVRDLTSSRIYYDDHDDLSAWITLFYLDLNLFAIN